MSGPVARAFLVVRLERAGDDLRSVVSRACVSATYGADGGDGTEHDRELVATVHAKNFAFPERDLSEAICDAAEEGTDAPPPLTYTFSLTEGDGSRTTGFCRRIAPAREYDGDGHSSGVIVACILSRNAWFSFFEEALASIDERVRALPQVRTPQSPPPCDASASGGVPSLGDELPAEGHLGRFMRELCARPTPGSGCHIVVPFPWHEPGTAYPSQIELAAPTAGSSSGNASNPDVAFASLLRQPGGTYAVVSLFAALLMERRVVISGSDLRRVSQAVVAANACMYPLAWQHIYLPLMPFAFVDYLTAPMPFLVGLHSSLVPAMRSLPTEDIFHLDLDGGECRHFPEDLDSMPTRTTQTLQSALEKAAAGGGGRHAPEGSDGDRGGSMHGAAVSTDAQKVDDAGAASAFRRFFSQTLGPYRRHIVQDGRKTRDGRVRSKENIGANGLWLDHEGLARAAPTKRTGVLLRQMRGAQYFEVFARERLDAIASALKAGEEVLYKDVDFDTEMDDYAEMYDAVRQSAARASAAAASYVSHGYKKSAEYYSSFVKSSYEAYTAYYNKNGSSSGSSTPRRGVNPVKRVVAVPGLGLATVASPTPRAATRLAAFSPPAGSPWEDSAERFRRATVHGASADGGSRDDAGVRAGIPEVATTATADGRDVVDPSGSVEKAPGSVEKVGGVDERFASPPPASPASPPTVALGDLLGLNSEPAGVPSPAEPSPAGAIGIDWMSDFVAPAGASKTSEEVDHLAASFDGLASPTPQKPGADAGPTNLLDL